MFQPSLRRSLLVALTAGIWLASIALPWTASADDALTADELALVKQAEQARIDVVSRVRPAVVAVYGNTRRGGGSGVIIDPAGYALTNHHVVAGAGKEGFGGIADGKLYRWKIIGTDPGGDVAIIQLTGLKAFPYAPLGDSDAARVGDFAMAMGNPFILAEDQKPTVTLGVISGIRRYQPGTGKTGNMLVYGNCIQVDSSINPGNSGGPLFDMTGGVIGINGRGSFKERGRVNVGLGYAISMKQIKNFIPELLATKLAQHGTLEAQFSNRRAGVICDALDLDAPAARIGLKLGDRLLKFEGETIKGANQFTNLISTFPAEWPVKFTVERDGKQHTFHVRLTALPYDNPPPPKKPAEKKPAEKKPAEKPGDKKPAKADEKKPAPKPAPRPTPARRPRANFGKPGEIRDLALNRRISKELAARWVKWAGSAEKVKGFHFVDDVVKDGEKIGRHELIVATDGRFRMVYDAGGRYESVTYNGATWQHTADRAAGPASRPAIEALTSPEALQAAVLAAATTETPLSALGELTLRGSDKAAGKRAYHLTAGAKDEADFHVWLSVLGPGEQPELRLLKCGHSRDGYQPRPSLTFSDYREVAGVKWPLRRKVVAGLAETVVSELVNVQIRPLNQLPADFPAEPK